MKYRLLGKTGLIVSPIGLGTEYLHRATRDTVISVVHEALDRGVNYIDLFLPSPDYRDNFGMALKRKRKDVVIAGHLGAVEKDGQYLRTRDPEICEDFFHDLLTRLQTDYIDILMLHYVDEKNDYQRIIEKNGILDLALRLKKEGKVRFIGMSSHQVPVALKAVTSGVVDVLMFPINPAFDVLTGNIQLETLWDEAATVDQNIINKQTNFERKKLYQICANYNVGLVGMKPYAAGWLFAPTNSSSQPMKPVQCLNYVLSQTGVSTVVPGVKNIEELRAALQYYDATDEEKDFSLIITNSRWNLKGHCMYCNHCLPCPVKINVGQIIQLVDIAQNGFSKEIQSKYDNLQVKASKCTECGACEERCPFHVNVTFKMKQGVELFE